MIKKYSGQTLAIVLVLLLVGSIVGFALYARFVRDSERVVEEKASAEANELVETVIGFFTVLDYETIEENACGSDPLPCRETFGTLEDLRNYIGGLGIELGEDAFQDFEEKGADYCSTEIALQLGTGDEEINIEQDQVYSVYFSEPTSECRAEFFMSSGGSAKGFVMSSFYKNALGLYKEYQNDDITGFSYNETGSEGWTLYSSEGLQFSNAGPYPISKDGYGLREVRFKSLNGASGLRWIINNCGFENKYLIMEFGATCGGSYAGKGFVIPGTLSAPPIFDYVLFSGKGELVPEPIPLVD